MYQASSEETVLAITFAFVFAAIVRWVAKIVLRRMREGTAKDVLSTRILGSNDRPGGPGAPRK